MPKKHQFRIRGFLVLLCLRKSALIELESCVCKPWKKLPPKISTRLQEKETVLWKLEFPKTCDILEHRSWSIALFHICLLFSCIGSVISKRRKKQLSSTQDLILQQNFERACQLHWHGNIYSNLDIRKAQRKGKELISQLSPQNALYKIL